MSKFTKGEWIHVAADFSDFDIAITTQARWDANDPNIAQVSVDWSGELAREQKANAHLISAAPDMYKLLEKFLPMDEDGNGWDFQYNEGSEHFGEEVVELLKKARGESC